MIEVIRSSGASSGVMQTAARGALNVPPQEMIEILVYLATQTKIFAERARLTLAGWDEASSLAAASDPRTPKEVLAYMVAPGNLRPTLLPALLENAAVPEEWLVELAAAAGHFGDGGHRSQSPPHLSQRSNHANPRPRARPRRAAIPLRPPS